MILIIKVLIFLFLKQIIARLNQKNNICINVFCYENDLVYRVHISKQKFDDHIDLLLISYDNKSHYVYIRDFNRLMFNKTKHKNMKHFSRYCIQCFSSEGGLQEHREI